MVGESAKNEVLGRLAVGTQITPLPKDKVRIGNTVVHVRFRSNPKRAGTVWSVRSLAPGQYVVNILHYKANRGGPVPVTVKVEKLNPEVEVVYYGAHELSGAGQELTAVRFELGESGNVRNVNRHEKLLLVKALRGKK